jgi:hypothetical protein
VHPAEAEPAIRPPAHRFNAALPVQRGIGRQGSARFESAKAKTRKSRDFASKRGPFRRPVDLLEAAP